MNALIVVHDNHQETNVFPLGSAYIASALQQENVHVDTYCMDVYHYNNSELATHIINNHYHMILLGFMVPRFRRTVRELCKTIVRNKNDDAIFILGGYGPSAIPEYIINETLADVICIGEADFTIKEIARSLYNRDKFRNIDGIVWRDGDSIITNKRRIKNKNLDLLPLPSWDIFPMDIYTTNLKYPRMKNGDKVFPLISTKGCTDKCSFCFRLESGIRKRSACNIINEMKILHDRYGVTYFHFLDELAIISKKQILNLTNEIKNNFSDIRYRMDCRVSLFDDEIAQSLKKSGCVFLNIGFESSSQLVLDQMSKRATVMQNINAAEIAIKHDIGIGVNMIWGMPGDNERTLRENASFIKKYNQYDQIRTIRPVTPYPGSPLYYKAIKEGFLDGPGDFFDKFENADRYMVNFMGIPEDDIYSMLIDVNSDLIYDHFKNTNNDMKKAEKMISDLHELYRNSSYIYTGPRVYSK